MADYNNFRAAFNIFDKYKHRKGIWAEHDVVYAGPNVSAVTPEDIAALDYLGWVPSDAGDGFMRFV